MFVEQYSKHSVSLIAFVLVYNVNWENQVSAPCHGPRHLYINWYYWPHMCMAARLSQGPDGRGHCALRLSSNSSLYCKHIHSCAYWSTMDFTWCEKVMVQLWLKCISHDLAMMHTHLEGPVLVLLFTVFAFVFTLCVCVCVYMWCFSISFQTILHAIICIWNPKHWIYSPSFCFCHLIKI